MLKVFKGIVNYKDQGKLGGWIKTIVVHCCIDFCKSKSIFNSTTNIISEITNMMLPDVFDRLSAKDIQQLIAQLPRATGTVFNLYIYEGFTHKQIAEQLNISDGTSKWHVSEAKKILKVKLENISETELKANAAG
jgi:RNA polymerase sigma-70 factor (ECF subfamily)